MLKSEAIFIMKDISKHFPGVQALDNVTFEVDRGEVHALVGENGAGKSTLIKILSGIQGPDSGQIFYKDQEIRINTPRDAQNLGISTIYQELNLCQNLTVAQNVFLGKESTRTLLHYLDEDQINAKCRQYLDLLEANIDPKALLSSLSVAQQQMVEIAKALSYESDVIIMDEPTATLTLHETDKLFETIRKLREQGRSVIYISHRLEEVFEIADTVTVLRDGKLVGTKTISELEYNDIVRMMVGREIQNMYVRPAETEKRADKALLEVKDFTKQGVFKNINFSLYGGEILGFSGLVGAGRTDLMRALFGLETTDAGKIIIKGKEQVFNSPKEAIQTGIGMTSEDRKKESLFLDFSVRENITIASMDAIITSGIVDSKKENTLVHAQMKQLDIKTPSSETKIISMSGGNQQKVAIARWLVTEPDILILDEPTRGIDVGSKAEIYKLMRQLTKQGKGIILVSSELLEILAVSDRIVVMNKGEIVGEFMNADATEEKIMELAV